MEVFPHPTIKPILGQPKYETLAKVKLKFNTNAAFVHSHLDNGQLGILFLPITPVIYNTPSKIVFALPANLGPYPVIPQGLTTAQITDTPRKYDVKSDLYTKYNMTDKSLKSLFIADIYETYIQSLRDKCIGYYKITTQEIMVHLYLAYAKNWVGILRTMTSGRGLNTT